MNTIRRLVMVGVLAFGGGCAVLDTTPTGTRELEARADGGSDGALEAAADAAPDAPTNDVTADVPGDTGTDVATNDANDGATDAAETGDSTPITDVPDAGEDVTTDNGPDASDASDAGGDVGFDLGVDMPPPPDVPTDAGFDAGTDAGPPDVGFDAGLDATDSGPDVTDTGVPDVSCPTGQTRCGGTCVDMQTDNANCGMCGNACPVGMPACSRGACTAICGTGETNCFGDCVDRNVSLMHCGTCGNACPVRANAVIACSTGSCGFTCNTGYGNCDGVASNGCEINTVSGDTANCGGCGMVCPARANATPTCASSTCSFTCLSSFNNCNGSASDGCEVNLTNDANNCGACGTVCNFAHAGATCVSSSCALGPCNTGYGNCDSNPATGCETDTTRSVTNCGGCGMACPARANAIPTCAASACGFTCTTGFGNCNGSATDGCEVNFATTNDANNCGACGRVCPSGVCSAGVCLTSPVVDLNEISTSVTGVWVRSADEGGSNPVGTWVYQPCAVSAPSRTCRIDLSRITTPTGGTVTAWQTNWGLEIIPVTGGSMTTPFCATTVSSCAGCGMGTSFSTSCLTATCASAGGATTGALRFEQLYNNTRPPGMAGSGTQYGLRLGMTGSGMPLCAR